MRYLFKNNATSRLKIPTPAASNTLTLLDGEGAKFPSPVAPDFCLVTIDDRRSGQMEICKCTGRTGDILQVVRGQEGSVAQDFVEWATVSNRITAGTFDYMLDVVLNAAGYPKDESDLRFLNADGDTATGPIKGVAPTTAEDLTRRDYVDTQVATRAPLAHTHPISDVVDLQPALDSKLGPAPVDGADYVQNGGVWSPLSWATLDGKPPSFPADPHTHPISDVTGLQVQLDTINAEVDTKVGPDASADGKVYGRQNSLWVDIAVGLHIDWNMIDNRPPSFPPEPHFHPISDVTGLQTALDGKMPGPDAPFNSKQHARINGTWAEVSGGGAGGGIPEAPTDGQIYGRQGSTTSWKLIPASGITQAEADARYEPLDSAYTKAEADAKYMTPAAAATNFVDATGDTMSGPLVVPAGTNALPGIATGAANTGIVGSASSFNISIGGSARFLMDTTKFTPTLPLRAFDGSNSAPAYAFNSGTNMGMYRAGADTLGFSVAGVARMTLTTATLAVTLPVALPADPASPLHAATKQYVDAQVGGIVIPPAIDAYTKTQSDARYVDNAGDNMTGYLYLVGDPTQPSHAATKSYVDAKPSGATISDTPPSSPVPGQFWWESDSGKLYLRYQDANSSQWVDASGTPTPPSVVEAPVDGKMYLRKNGAWAEMPLPANDDGEYVMRNGVWRLKEQSFDVSLLIQQDILVPVGAKAAWIEGVIHQISTAACAITMRMSGDGTNFNSGATDYTEGSAQHSTGTGAYQTSAAVGASTIVLSPSSDTVNIAHVFDSQVQLVRPSTSAVFMVKSFAKCYHSSAANQYRTWWAGSNLGASATAALAIKALRIYCTTNFGAGSMINVKWIY